MITYLLCNQGPGLYVKLVENKYIFIHIFVTCFTIVCLSDLLTVIYLPLSCIMVITSNNIFKKQIIKSQLSSIVDINYCSYNRKNKTFIFHLFRTKHLYITIQIKYIATPI